jgi:hypothetical protein
MQPFTSRLRSRLTRRVPKRSQSSTAGLQPVTTHWGWSPLLGEGTGEVAADHAADRPSRAPGEGPGWRRPVCWAITLTSALLPALTPEALGDWWMLGSIVGLRVAFWVWISGVPPLRRGSDS